MSKEVIGEDNKAKKEEQKSMVKKDKIKKSISATTAIGGVIVFVLIIAIGLFGLYFYKTNGVAVATYDGGKVTRSEYTIYYKTFQPMLVYFGYPDDIIPEQIANKAALDEIIVKDAKKAGVTIPEDRKKEIDKQFEDKEQLTQLEKQGINPIQMKQLYYTDALISAYIDKLVEDANDEDVINYIKSKEPDANLTSYETSHILFRTSSDTGAALSDEEKAAKKAKAEDTLNRIKSGEDFETLAKELSEDTGTKDNGGKYTVYMDSKTEENYANAAKSMDVGDVVLVESSFGYHVIKLNNVDENGRAKNSEDREDYVNEKINSISTEKNIKANEENLKKAVEKITGKSSSDNNDSEDKSTSNDESGTSTEVVEPQTTTEQNTEE